MNGDDWEADDGSMGVRRQRRDASRPSKHKTVHKGACCAGKQPLKSSAQKHAQMRRLADLADRGYSASACQLQTPRCAGEDERLAFEGVHGCPMYACAFLLLIYY